MIVLSREQRLRFQLRDVVFRCAEFLVQLFQQIILLVCVGLLQGQVYVRFNIAGDRGEFLVRSDLLFGAFPLSQNALRRFLIVPEIWIRDPRFE